MDSVIETTFQCAACGDVAATVALLPPFASYALIDGLPGDRGGINRDKPRLVIAGPLSLTHTLSADHPHVNAQIGHALLAGDAAALYAIDDEWASFWCPLCAASYCRKHWEIREVYDDDGSHWYDCTYGTCPKGHQRKLDD